MLLDLRIQLWKAVDKKTLAFCVSHMTENERKVPSQRKFRVLFLAGMGVGHCCQIENNRCPPPDIFNSGNNFFLMIIALYFIERCSIPCLRCSTDKFVLYSLVKISNVVFCTAQEARTPSPGKFSFHTSLKRVSQKGPCKASLGSLIPLPCSWVTEPGVSCWPKMSHQIL